MLSLSFMTLNQIFLHPVNRYISWETILHLSLKGQILLLSDGKNVCKELVLFCRIFLCWNSFLWINFFFAIFIIASVLNLQILKLETNFYKDMYQDNRGEFAC